MLRKSGRKVVAVGKPKPAATVEAPAAAQREPSEKSNHMQVTENDFDDKTLLRMARDQLAAGRLRVVGGELKHAEANSTHIDAGIVPASSSAVNAKKRKPTSKPLDSEAAPVSKKAAVGKTQPTPRPIHVASLLSPEPDGDPISSPGASSTQSGSSKPMLSEEEKRALEEERKRKAEQRLKDKAARELIMSTPNQLVSFNMRTLSKKNAVHFTMSAWPEVELKLDHLVPPDEKGKVHGCPLCVAQWKQWTEWYALHPEKLHFSIADDFVLPSAPAAAGMAVDNPLNHEHEITVEGTVLKLPKIGLTAAAKKRLKARAVSSSPTSMKDDDDDSEPLVVPVAAPVRRSGRAGPGISPVDESDDVSMAAESEAENEDATLDVTLKQVDTWHRTWVKYITSVMYFQRTGDTLTVDAVPMKTPNEVQQGFVDAIATVDFTKTKPSNLLQMWDVWKAGIGKTLGVPFALLNHPCPPERVVFVTPITVVHQTAAQIMTLRQLNSCIHYEILGPDELEARIHSNPKYLDRVFLVYDEVHELRNLTVKMMPMIKAMLDGPLYRTYLTGTLLPNDGTNIYYVQMLRGKLRIEMNKAEREQAMEIERERRKRSKFRGGDGGDSKADYRFWSLKNIKDLQPADFQAPVTADQLEALYNSLGGGDIFFFEPTSNENCPRRYRVDRVELSWPQTLQWWRLNTNSPQLADLRIQTSTSNGFKGLAAQVENCYVHTGPDGKKTVFASKFKSALEDIKRAAAAPNRAMFPVVVHSNNKGLGVHVLRDMLKEDPDTKDLVVEVMSAEVDGDKREVMRQRCVNGHIAVLLLTPVGDSSLDLPNTACLIGAEVSKSPGAEEQRNARVLRGGATPIRPELIVDIIQKIAVFPDRNKVPTREEEDMMWEMLEDFSKFDKKTLQKTYGVDLVRNLKEQLDLINWKTADELRAESNAVKDENQGNVMVVVKAVTRDLNGHSKKYREAYHAMIKALRSKEAAEASAACSSGPAANGSGRARTTTQARYQPTETDRVLFTVTAAGVVRSVAPEVQDELTALYGVDDVALEFRAQNRPVLTVSTTLRTKKEIATLQSDVMNTLMEILVNALVDADAFDVAECMQIIVADA
jgi:hypothetical protein